MRTDPNNNFKKESVDKFQQQVKLLENRAAAKFDSYKFQYDGTVSIKRKPFGHVVGLTSSDLSAWNACCTADRRSSSRRCACARGAPARRSARTACRTTSTSTRTVALLLIMNKQTKQNTADRSVDVPSRSGGRPTPWLDLLGHLFRFTLARVKFNGHHGGPIGCCPLSSMRKAIDLGWLRKEQKKRQENFKTSSSQSSVRFKR